MKELLPALIGSLVRWLLTVAAGAGITVAPDVETQLTLGAVALFTLVWSWIQKRNKKPGTPPLVVLFATLAISLSLSACASVSQNDCLRRIAATETAITQGYTTTNRLLASDVIDKKTATKALVALDAANAATDSAAPLCKIGDPRASDYLLQAGTALIDFAMITGEK